MSDKINYSELLNSDEWKKKRELILKRDEFACCSCNLKFSETDYFFKGTTSVKTTEEVETVFGIKARTKFINLHVHHKYYILEKLPWEYPDGALIALCETCHQKLHESEKIKVFREINGNLEETNLTACKRCDGWGWIPPYMHIQSGICFECGGARFYKLN